MPWSLQPENIGKLQKPHCLAEEISFFRKDNVFGLSSFLCQSVDNYRAQKSEFMHRERLLS